MSPGNLFSFAPLGHSPEYVGKKGTEITDTHGKC